MTATLDRFWLRLWHFTSRIALMIEERVDDRLYWRYSNEREDHRWTTDSTGTHRSARRTKDFRPEFLAEAHLFLVLARKRKIIGAPKGEQSASLVPQPVETDEQGDGPYVQSEVGEAATASDVKAAEAGEGTFLVPRSDLGRATEETGRG